MDGGQFDTDCTGKASVEWPEGNTATPTHGSRRRGRNPVPCPRDRGFTIVEVAAAAALIAILVAIAVPAYNSYVQRVKVATAVADITNIMGTIQLYYVNHDHTYPPDAAAIGIDGMLDPWGNPYVYLSFAGLKGKGAMRKDKNLVPINSFFDLYSTGADGQSVPPITAAPSRDDIIMANDGEYVGLASNY